MLLLIYQLVGLTRPRSAYRLNGPFQRQLARDIIGVTGALTKSTELSVSTDSGRKAPGKLPIHKFKASPTPPNLSALSLITDVVTLSPSSVTHRTWLVRNCRF
ncbi:unnamed protein product [Leuciscus chuanchicus]